MDDFTAYYEPLLDAVYDSLDRLVVNAYYPLAQSPGGLRTWWRRFREDSQLTTDQLMRLAARFSRRARAWAKENDIPVIFCSKGTRMHQLAEQYLPEDPSFRGVFLILVSREPAPVWEVSAFPSGAMNIRRREPWPYVNHYYFHLIDPDWGHMAIGVCCHPPFRARILLNGHEWLARQADRHGIPYRKLDNCFVDLPDPDALNRLAETLTEGHVRAVCERWIYGLCFGLSETERDASGFRYSYSAPQVEHSRNLLFTSPRTMQDVYQRVIDQTRRTLTPRSIRTIFGRATRGRRPKRIEVRIERPTFDMTVVKLSFGTITLKLYDKGERTLRAECIEANTTHLGVGRSLERLPQMLPLLKAYLVNYLNHLHAADRAFLDYGTLDQLTEPTFRGSRRIPGIDIDKARCRALLRALTDLAPKAEGFTNAEMRRIVQAYWKPARPYTSAAMSYDFAKLAAKGFVERVPRTRRYTVPSSGLRTAVALLNFRSRLLEPILSGIHQRPRAGRPKKLSPLDERYGALHQALEDLCVEIGIAA